MTHTAMFDWDALPQIVMNGDTARTRKSDPLTSHVAADVSSKHLHETKQRVLELIATHGPMVGSEVNDLYRLTAARLNWRRVAFDTPRKRSQELLADGYLEVTSVRTAEGNNLPERCMGLTDAGLAALS